jgi:hypothetical protein
VIASEVAALLFALSTATMPASAHKASDSYLTLTRTGSDSAAISGRWDIALRDLDNAITLDTNGDGDISWGEVRARHRSIADYALSRLTVESNGTSCTITAGEQLIEQHSDGCVHESHADRQLSAARLRLTSTIGSCSISIRSIADCFNMWRPGPLTA